VRAVEQNDLDGYGPSTLWWWGYVVRNEGELTIQDVQSFPRDDPNWNVDYSMYLGYEVTVSGVVTTPGTFNQQYGAYVIQNGPGADWAGICVRGIDDNLNVGDLIEVTGTVREQDDDPQYVDEWEYATWIDVTSHEVLGSPGSPRPLTVELSELVWSERAEELEGVYVRIENFEIEGIYPAEINLGYWRIINVNTESTSWFTTNGLTDEVIQDQHLYLKTDEDEKGLVRHTQFEWMQGVFTENWGFYGVAPIDDSDVGPLEVEEDGVIRPHQFALDPAYPNPFNASTNIGFELAVNGYARLALYDLTGREIAVIAVGDLRAGRYSYNIDASALSTGVYIMRLDAGSQSASRKLVLMK